MPKFRTLGRSYIGLVLGVTIFVALWNTYQSAAGGETPNQVSSRRDASIQSITTDLRRPLTTAKSNNTRAKATSTRRPQPSVEKRTLNFENSHSGNSSSILARQFYYNEPDDYRVPFWNIAHMINSIEEIEPALRAGANGIEVDISFDKRGIPSETYHGFPCDCGRHCHSRENFVKFIQHVAKITLNEDAHTNLQIVLLDLKLKDLNDEQKKVAGKYLAAILHEHLYSNYVANFQQGELTRPPVRFVVSINHVTDRILINAFMNHMYENRLDFMSKQVGFDVGMNDSLEDINAMWNAMPWATFNIWQGDGLTNCANIIRGVERLKEAINIRNGQGHFRKIYYWTADVMYLIRSVLRLGLDAMLTNQPQRVIHVIEEPEFKAKYRLATHYDNPFAQFWIRPSAWQMSPPTLSEAVETVTNIHKTSANFVKTLPDGIAGALQKVHESIIPIS